MQLIHDQLGFFPILLLDDVSSELDKQRNEDLMNYLNTAGAQIFITTTDRRWIRLGDNQKVFTVSGGIIA
jgi:DNA replication and repair protein RecF